MGPEGLQPQQPTDLLSQLLAAVSATNPGYTSNLPGSLIEDISSTDVAALAIIDQAKVELVNSLTPNGANNFLLLQLGYIYGVELGSVTNTSVPVVFSSNQVGYVIPDGMLIGDGSHTYQVKGGGVIGGGGTSATLTAVALVTDSFSVPANTVTTILTSVSSGMTLTVNNPNPGTPGGSGESNYSFRSRIMQAGLAASVGTPRYIKTLIGNVAGVKSSSLIAVQQATAGIRVIVGGSASTYDIAYALFCSVADPSALVGSAINGGRNVTVTLYDYPNSYSIVYVLPPVQTITMTVTWNTVLTLFTGGSAFPALTQGPLAAYINSIPIGAPINVLEMNEVFQNAIAALLDPTLLTRLVFAVSINGSLTAPGTGTYAVTGDAEGYFTCLASGISVVQG
jgi:hypothetical protein